MLSTRLARAFGCSSMTDTSLQLRLMCGHFDFFFAWSGKYITRTKGVYTQHFGYFIFKILNHAQIRIARP